MRIFDGFQVLVQDADGVKTAANPSAIFATILTRVSKGMPPRPPRDSTQSSKLPPATVLRFNETRYLLEVPVEQLNYRRALSKRIVN